MASPYNLKEQTYTLGDEDTYVDEEVEKVVESILKENENSEARASPQSSMNSRLRQRSFHINKLACATNE